MGVRWLPFSHTIPSAPTPSLYAAVLICLLFFYPQDQWFKGLHWGYNLPST
jgi:hypothetical protein